MENLLPVLLLLFLAAMAYEDWKTQELHVLAIGIGGALGIAVRLLLGLMQPVRMLPGMFLGIVLLLISYASKEGIGYGDGLLMIAVGTYLDGTSCVFLFLLALLLAVIYAAMAGLVGKKSLKSRISFTPFLLSGYVIWEGLCG